MKTLSLTAVLTSLLLTLGNAWAVTQEQAESMCTRFALEDQVEESEKGAYMQECIVAALNGEYGEPEARDSEDREDDRDSRRD